LHQNLNKMDVTHAEYDFEQTTDAPVASVAPVSSTETDYENNYVTDYEIERQKPMPSKLHSIVQGNLYFEFRMKYRDKYKAYPELTLDLSGKNPVPDLCLLEAEPTDYAHDEIKVATLPLLVVEILSPRQSIEDIKDKISNIYNPAGVKSIWLVIPPLKTVSLVLPDGEFHTITSGIVKDLYLDIELNMADIFS
jgi:Uma2 family endonuclease